MKVEKERKKEKVLVLVKLRQLTERVNLELRNSLIVLLTYKLTKISHQYFY